MKFEVVSQYFLCYFSTTEESLLQHLAKHQCVGYVQIGQVLSSSDCTTPSIVTVEHKKSIKVLLSKCVNPILRR